MPPGVTPPEVSSPLRTPAPRHVGFLGPDLDPTRGANLRLLPLQVPGEGLARHVVQAGLPPVGDPGQPAMQLRRDPDHEPAGERPVGLLARLPAGLEIGVDRLLERPAGLLDGLPLERDDVASPLDPAEQLAGLLVDLQGGRVAPNEF
jgi:hypothetical protein